MDARKQTQGSCRFCSRAMTRGGMARHLETCGERQKEIARADARKASGEAMLHVQLEDASSGDYWLQLEMAGSAPLRSLDQYLRAIWLECCGHKSQFVVGDPWRGKQISTNARAARVLLRGTPVTHVYDFGTSSYTKIALVGRRSGNPLTKHPILLMARNDPPEIRCMDCSQSAVVLCMECVLDDDREGGLCESHARGHPHEAYGEALPVVNSPRLGMCGYTGPAEAPY